MRCTQMSVHQKRLRIVQRLIFLALRSAQPMSSITKSQLRRRPETEIIGFTKPILVA